MNQQGKITLDLNVASDENLRAWVKDLIQGQVKSIMASDLHAAINANIEKWTKDYLVQYFKNNLHEMGRVSEGAFGARTKDTIKGMIQEYVKEEVEKALVKFASPEFIRAEIQEVVTKALNGLIQQGLK